MKALRCLLVALGVGMFAASQAFAQAPAPPKTPPPTPEQVQRDIESTRTLIETSKSAVQIKASESAESKAKQDEARGLLKQAEEAKASGDLAKASSLLTETKKKMFEAVRLANPQQVAADKAHVDYGRRLETVKVLRNALPSGGKNAEVVKTADAAIAEAEQLAAAKKYSDALAALNKGYTAVRLANIEQRDKTEQVASKNFATKEDEYKYEIGRNDDYAGLSRGVMESMNPQMATIYRGVLDKGASLRKDAEAAAKRGDFESGVTSLEQSTGEYKKVVRAAGIPVP